MEDAQKSGTFTAYKRQRIGEDGDAFAVYTDMFDAVETGHSLYPKRKADQELPHLVSSELEFAGTTTVVVSDVFVNSAKTGTMPAILETDDVEAEADCGVKGRVTDPFDFNWIFISPAKESEKHHNEKFVFSGISDMVLEVQSETGSAVKRRRMLHFDDHPMETSFFSSELSSIHESSVAREEAYDELLPEGSQLIEGFPEWFPQCLNDPVVTPTLPDDLEALDLYAANWYADCFNDPETPTQHADLSFGSPKVQIDVSDYLNVSPETETREFIRRPVTRSSPNVIFRRMKSFARPVMKLSSSFIYPFNLVKPCDVHGDMTLKDINQKIRTPAAKPKDDKAEPPVIQTSLFSGKPVVRKTKFRTEGGNEPSRS